TSARSSLPPVDLLPMSPVYSVTYLAGQDRRSTFSHKGRRKRGGRGDYFPFTTLRQCSHAARIKFSLASGVRKAECADSVTFSSFVKGWSAGSGSMLKTSRPA